jgi:hypothetical protein
MGQIRSILRGIAYDRPESPAQVLSRVDGVLTGLGVGSLATALVARLEQPPEQAAAGLRTLRWSSAGHLPPLLVHADARVETLATSPERLLGAESTCSRSDHELVLTPGDTVVLYTDGLVENRAESLDVGLERLRSALEGLDGTATPGEVCDRVLERTGRVDGADDDVALLVLVHDRVPTEEGP